MIVFNVTESKLGGYYFTGTRNLLSNRRRKSLLLCLFVFFSMKFKNGFRRSDEETKSDTKIKCTRDMKMNTFCYGSMILYVTFAVNGGKFSRLQTIESMLQRSPCGSGSYNRPEKRDAA